MRIARLERVRRDERGAAIGGLRVLLLIEDHHDHGDVEGARGVVANLNVGMEELHVAEPLAERDALMDVAEHIGVHVRARYCYYHCCYCSGRLVAVPLF
jgi:hypothetical protein